MVVAEGAGGEHPTAGETADYQTVTAAGQIEFVLPDGTSTHESCQSPPPAPPPTPPPSPPPTPPPASELSLYPQPDNCGAIGIQFDGDATMYHKRMTGGTGTLPASTGTHVTSAMAAAGYFPSGTAGVCGSYTAAHDETCTPSTCSAACHAVATCHAFTYRSHSAAGEDRSYCVFRVGDHTTPLSDTNLFDLTTGAFYIDETGKRTIYAIVNDDTSLPVPSSGLRRKLGQTDLYFAEDTARTNTVASGCFTLGGSKDSCCSSKDGRDAYLNQRCFWKTGVGGCQPEQFLLDSGIPHDCQDWTPVTVQGPTTFSISQSGGATDWFTGLVAVEPVKSRGAAHPRVAAAMNSDVDGTGTYGAANAIDDDTAEAGGSIAHSAYFAHAGETAPWLMIDMGEEHAVYEVDIYNRQDCCFERLSWNLANNVNLG